MKLVEDPDTAQWLAVFAAQPEFDWDEGNAGKSLRKHGISDEEIESLFLDPNLGFAGQVAGRAHGEWRGLLLAMTPQGRLLALIFTRRGDELRPISCRPMRLEERRFYAARSQS